MGFTAIAILSSFPSSVFPPPLPLEDHLWNHDYILAYGFLIFWKGIKQQGLDNGKLPRLVQEFLVLILALLLLSGESSGSHPHPHPLTKCKMQGLNERPSKSLQALWFSDRKLKLLLLIFHWFLNFFFSNPWLWNKSNTKMDWWSYLRTLSFDNFKRHNPSFSKWSLRKIHFQRVGN